MADQKTIDSVIEQTSLSSEEIKHTLPEEGGDLYKKESFHRKKMEAQKVFTEYFLMYAEAYYQPLFAMINSLVEKKISIQQPIIHMYRKKEKESPSVDEALKTYYIKIYPQLSSWGKILDREIEAIFSSGKSLNDDSFKEVEQNLFFLRERCVCFTNAFDTYLKNVCDALIDECAHQQKTYDSRKEKGFLSKVKGMLSKDKKKRSDSPLSIEFINTDEVRVQLAAIFTRLEEKRKAVLKDIESVKILVAGTFSDRLEDDSFAIRSRLKAMSDIAAELPKILMPVVNVITEIKQVISKEESTLSDSSSESEEEGYTPPSPEVSKEIQGTEVVGHGWEYIQAFIGERKAEEDVHSETSFDTYTQGRRLSNASTDSGYETDLSISSSVSSDSKAEEKGKEQRLQQEKARMSPRMQCFLERLKQSPISSPQCVEPLLLDSEEEKADVSPGDRESKEGYRPPAVAVF